MAQATFEIPHFLGGEISKVAQGRFDRPDYKVSLNVCLNAAPLEMGAWCRRPGTRHARITRGGAAGRKIKFDFEQANAVTMELTDGYVRFRSGAELLGTNDDQLVVAVSSANPAVVQVTNAVTWSTGDTLMFIGAATALLENRQFTATKIDTTHFSIADALTGATIDGSTLGALAAGATVRHVQELATPYLSGAWSSVRAVQAETTDILLCSTVAPQALTVSTMPDDPIEAQFAITPATFNDGPYLDPFVNGVQATPSALKGIISLTLSFPAYDSGKAYAKGAFITYSGVNYTSLVDQNVGNTPNTSPTAWTATSASAAINDGRGFLGSDTGRLVRLFSEPPAWVSTTAYTANTSVVAYNPSGIPGATTYWMAIANNTGKAPGSDLVNWQIIAQGAAIWTWGRITGLSNVIDRQLAGSVSIGDMTLFNGITAPFDGNFSKSISSSAAKTASGFATTTTVGVTGYVGKNYSGASAQRILQATVYPSNDRGFGFGTYVGAGGVTNSIPQFYTLNLRAKNTAPANSSDGTLLGTASFSGSSSATTILSSDTTTAWNYVWIEVTMSGPVGIGASYSVTCDIAQISFFNPTSSGTSGAGCNVEILGPALLYSQPVTTWRLGVFSDTTGWPTCGCYDGARIWLGGAVANRFDACVSNGITGSSINFAPTDQYGAVATSNAISYVLNSDSVNPIYWMRPDLQGIIMGTKAGEYLVLAPGNGPISPTNIKASRVTKIGSANIEPCHTEHTNIFVQRYRRKLMEYFADAYSGKFTGPNIADKADHITAKAVAELAYCSAVTPTIWGRCDDGSLFGITYKRDTLTTTQGPTYAAWHPHALGTGRIVESICAGPSVGGDLDTLSMVTNDTSTGIRHVEVLTDTPNELDDLADGWFLDDALNPTSSIITSTPAAGSPFGGVTLNGLWHLNGKTVQVFANGLDCGDRGDNTNTFTDFAVSNGSVFVPFGDGTSAGSGRGLFTLDFLNNMSLSQIVVGMTYNSDGQAVRRNDPAETGARNGPALGKKRRSHRYAMLISNGKGLSVGTDFATMMPALFRQSDDKTAIGTLDMFSGIHQDALKDDYSYDSMVCWRVSRPFPMTLVALAINTAAQDQ